MKPRRATDPLRLALVLLARCFAWREALTIVQPGTLLRWHREAFRISWHWRSRPGRPRLPAELQQLIAAMARDNLTSGEERGRKTIHVVPNVLAPVIVQVTLSFSTAILAEATLSYLGLGTQPPDPSWGTMLASGRKYLDLAPSLTVFPGVAIMLAVLGFNLLGDALRDALDPRLKQR